MTLSHPLVETGRGYTRAEISKILGGSPQPYLPHKDGRVVAGCFSVKKGPFAPREILVGEGSGVEGSAAMLCQQAEAIPVFMKGPEVMKGEGRWFYSGMYRVGHWTQDPEVLARYAEEGGRGTLTRVMFLIRA
ncbi:hypothetical protein ACFP9V_24205 [Deinococcus radiopugnans]|uniref:Uncharacterized protein n=2 Tax=Deinococcus radiopugnans TaxID=57497 RepID=A0A5C4XUX9_9DEIO|nr:hypothetical protein [Deinococcus radiopugnans]MBB6018649.1 hypothetical protein [Deinococcus radiopugnans ATCC 19172]TNM67058.1 hypothetical protein FHR04_19005 [Deinococcus radiopugnans ATCC 19172]